MKYTEYAKSLDTPSRKLRKSQRNTVFQINRKMRKALKKAARLAR